YQEIYLKANSQEQIKKYEKMFNQVFNQCLKDLETNNQEAVIYQDFLNKMEPSYIIENSPCRIVIDFIAGMTDAYLVKQVKEQAIDKLN
ncbi:MAG TPA: phosphohydrolase, partial [Bacilli bacterium]|nr:phosphohydrolase [Bacilli bacterium]